MKKDSKQSKLIDGKELILALEDLEKEVKI